MDKQIEQMFAAIQSRIDNLEKKFDTLIVRANSGVDENSGGLFDVAAIADENSQAIMDLAELIAEKDGE